MTPIEEVDYIVHDCVFAVGQGVGTAKAVDGAAVAWLRSRYRDKFLQAMIGNGNTWARDRHRVTAVSRFLGVRALHHAGQNACIDVACIAKAAADLEAGCRMNAGREAGLPHVTIVSVQDPSARRSSRRRPTHNRNSQVNQQGGRRAS